MNKSFETFDASRCGNGDAFAVGAGLSLVVVDINSLRGAAPGGWWPPLDKSFKTFDASRCGNGSAFTVGAGLSLVVADINSLRGAAPGG